MWHEEHKNLNLPHRTTSPKKVCGDYNCSKVLPPVENLAGSFNGLSGKRKSAAIDVTRVSNNKVFRSPVGVNEEGTKYHEPIKKSFVEQVVSRQQLTTHEHNYQPNNLEVWATSGADSQRSGEDKMNDASLSTRGGSLQLEEAPSTMMTVEETVMAPFQQAWPCQTEAHKSSSVAKSCNELKHNCVCLSTVGTSNCLDTKRCGNCEALENEVQLSGSMLGCPSENTYVSDEQNHDSSQLKAAAAAQDMENSKTLMDDISSSNGSRPDRMVEDGQKIVHHYDPSEPDDTIKLISEKPSITVAENLWDGRVQLSSSVTVSAVAFFKSGEKLPDTSWSDFIEVKGKVRLEAFEKYVQDLPRSRNRGLMVISLCWKEGSSETEFAGMKEVSNGYKRGGKVGYAKLSASTDLYICPRSDTIFTILAKHGFLKGMSAIDDNQDSLIGCVVWRKSQFSLCPVTKTLESNYKSLSGQPMASVSGSLLNQPTKSSQYVEAISSPSFQCSAGNGSEIKKIDSSNVRLEINKSSSANTVSATPVPSNTTVTEVAKQISILSHGPCQASSSTLLEVEASLTAITGLEQSKVSWKEKNAVFPCHTNVKILCSFDEDDLPEYDFGIACGVSSTELSKSVGVSLLDMNLLADRNCKQDAPSQRLDDINVPNYHTAPYQGMTSPIVVCERACEVFPNHNREEQCSSHGKAMAIPPTMLTKNRLFYDDDDMPEWCPPEPCKPYKQLLGEANTPPITLPPKLPNSSLANSSSVAARPVTLPPPPPRPVTLPPPPHRPVILPPPPPSLRSQFSYQQLNPVVQVPSFISSNSINPVHIQSSSGISLGFNSNSALRPQSSSLVARPPYQFSRRADWRP